MSSSTQAGRSGWRGGSTLAALILGLPLTVGLLAIFHHGPLRGTYVARYVEFPVQWIEVGFFCCGAAALFIKYLQVRQEQAVCYLELLPRWDGKPTPIEKAQELLSGIDKLSARIRSTYLGRRLRAALDFLRRRKSAQDLDDQLRALTDADALAQEQSYGLVRFITWAIPILGFLGTVIGITGAIGGVTPEVLEESLSSVTDGLAEAFDSTALALGLTMLLMFLTYLVERQEQAVLVAVDLLVEDQLSHRFQRESTDSAPFLDIVRQSTQALSASVEGLVEKQAQVWAQALGNPEQRAVAAYQQAQATLAGALGQAMDQTIEAYSQRLAALEQHAHQQMVHLVSQLGAVADAVRETGREQQQALTQVAQGVAGQASVLGKLQEDATNLVHLQAVLHQNLAALASASSFEEAVHSLTAAVHLLTARATGGSTPAPRVFQGGKAA
ncbi:MAG: MotA/TolQ/ExbB proton channel family protein [Gemmataceae bacterium]